MEKAKEILVKQRAEVIDGTIRAILKDTVSYLPWAKGNFVCIIFNLRTPHTPDGRLKTGKTSRALLDACIFLGGCFSELSPLRSGRTFHQRLVSTLPNRVRGNGGA